MSESTHYAITPEDLQRAAWRGSLYTVIAAALTGLAMVLLGEIIEELFLASLFVYAGIGWAAGTGMKHAFEYSEELPARVLSLLYTLLGILVARWISVAIVGVMYGAMPPSEVIQASLFHTGAGMFYWFDTIFSFVDPIGSIFGLISPLVALAIAWRSTTHDDADVVY